MPSKGQGCILRASPPWRNPYDAHVGKQHNSCILGSARWTESVLEEKAGTPGGIPENRADSTSRMPNPAHRPDGEANRVTARRAPRARAGQHADRTRPPTTDVKPRARAGREGLPSLPAPSHARESAVGRRPATQTPHPARERVPRRERRIPHVNAPAPPPQAPRPACGSRQPPRTPEPTCRRARAQGTSTAQRDPPPLVSRGCPSAAEAPRWPCPHLSSPADA